MRLATSLFFGLLVFSLLGQEPSHSGIHPEDMDPTCKPCTDFWRYVNGGWLDKNPIPAHLASWGTFAVLTDANQERTKTILDVAVSDRTANPHVRKLGDLYASCMDTTAIDKRGISPLQPDFDRIAAIRSAKDLDAVIAGFQRIGRPFGAVNGIVVGPFRLTSGQDPKNPSRVIARIVERDAAGRTASSIFSLPDRDYYLKTDPKSRETRDAFLEHAARMLELAGTPHADAPEQARTVLAFETALAGSVMNVADKRDPDKVYHLMDLAALRALAPAFDWAQLLREEGLPETTPINVTEPELIRKINQQLTAVPLADWKVWLHWRALKVAAPYLAKPIADEDFHFERTVLAGVQQQPPRWQTCAQVVDRDLSDALGEAWVAKYFPPEAKRRMSALVENLRGALRFAGAFRLDAARHQAERDSQARRSGNPDRLPGSVERLRDRADQPEHVL
jgi:predicted metalloendopeptidase